MKHRKKSRIAIIISALMAIALLCGATFAGVYAVPSSQQAMPDNATSTIGQYQINNQTGDTNATAQTVIIENVEIRRYEGEDGHPYIYNIRTNHTDQTIVSYVRGMLAFDKDGNPLKIDWWGFFQSTAEPEHLNLYTDESADIPAGETVDSGRGWSLNVMGEDTAAEQIAYVLYCDKEITFADGTTWENPEFDTWLATFKGKKIDVNVLGNYYPFEQTILNEGEFYSTSG